MKQYKKNMRTFLLALCGLGVAASCSDMFEPESNSVVFDHTLNRPTDSLYSAMGILGQMQKLSERYVLMGELRGDLMNTTGNAVLALQDVANFNVTPDNAYCDMSDYYSVINNCNFAITRMDTSLVNFDTKEMMPEFVAIKTMRAWTYWQIALLRGDAKWMTEPVLSLDDANRQYPVKTIDEIAEELIKDLTPFIGTRELDYGDIGSYSSHRYFIPMDLLLGDLYLYLNRYDEAAEAYYRYIYKNSLDVSGYRAELDQNGYARSASFISSYTGEMLCGLPSNEAPTGYHPELIRMAYNTTPAIIPAESFVTYMAEKPYFFRDNENDMYGVDIRTGDARGAMPQQDGNFVSVSYGKYADKADNMHTLITKYNAARSSSSGYDPDNELVNGVLWFTGIVPIYRTSMVYLRYAEALNRSGRPSVAMAVLRNGLRRETTTSGANCRVNLWEVNASYVDFTADRFNNNRGTMQRGRGIGVSSNRDNVNELLSIPNYTREWAVAKDAEGNVIDDITKPVLDDEGNPVFEQRQKTDDEGNLMWEDEEQTIPVMEDVPVYEPLMVGVHTEESMNDSILFVEDMIVDEMAAETAFEGNRFFDLLRVARHRNEFPGYMAEKVAVRFGERKEAMKAALLNRDKWFLK